MYGHTCSKSAVVELQIHGIIFCAEYRSLLLLHIYGMDYNDYGRLDGYISYHIIYFSMYGHTCSKSMDQPGKVASPARGQLNRENKYFPVPVRA